MLKINLLVFVVLILLQAAHTQEQACSTFNPCKLTGGDNFTTPPVLRSTEGKLELTLTVDVSAFTFEWLTVFRRSYNGSIPGPTWLIKPGDTVEVTLINNLEPVENSSPENTLRFPNTTNLHTHGLHISPKLPQDNVFLAVNPGESYTYVYQIENDHPAGTYWYHAHLHGSATLQLLSGMAGLIIVEDPTAGAAIPSRHLADISCPENCQHDVALLFQPVLQYADVSTFGRGFALLQNTIGDNELFRNMEPTQYNITLEQWLTDVNNSFDYQTTNGKVFPVITIAAGQRKRFRMVNAGGSKTLEVVITNVGGREQTSACEVWEIAVDGLYLNAARKPRLEKSFLASSARIDWIVVCNQPGVYELRSVPNPIDNCSLGLIERYDNVLLTISVKGDPVTPTSQDTELPPRPSYVSDFLNVTSEQIFPQRFTVEASFLSFLNREKFSGPDNYRFQIPVNSFQEWHLINNDALDGHPMHLHTNHFQVVSYNNYTGPVSTFTIDGQFSLVYFSESGELCDLQVPSFSGGPGNFPGINKTDGSRPCGIWEYPDYPEYFAEARPGTLSYVEPGEFRDVIMLPPLSNVTVRFQAHKFTGGLAVHCHTVIHGDLGMIMVIEIVEEDAETPVNDSPELQDLARCFSGGAQRVLNESLLLCSLATMLMVVI